MTAVAPAYRDCALPDDCECRKRGYPNADHSVCLVPAINATVQELGWSVPYVLETKG